MPLVCPRIGKLQLWAMKLFGCRSIPQFGCIYNGRSNGIDHIYPHRCFCEPMTSCHLVVPTQNPAFVAWLVRLLGNLKPLVVVAAAEDYFQRPQMNEIFARKTDELRRQSVPEAVQGVNSERLGMSRQATSHQWGCSCPPQL